MLSSLLKPSALAFVSKNTVGKQGKAMGITESYMSLGRIIGPLWGGMIFDVNLYYPYLSGILLLLIMFIATVSRVKLDKNPELKSNQ